METLLKYLSWKTLVLLAMACLGLYVLFAAITALAKLLFLIMFSGVFVALITEIVKDAKQK